MDDADALFCECKILHVTTDVQSMYLHPVLTLLPPCSQLLAVEP